MTARIEAILHHQPDLLPIDEVTEAKAQRIVVSNLLQRNQEYASSDESKATADYCNVGIEQLAYDALQSL